MRNARRRRALWATGTLFAITLIAGCTAAPGEEDPGTPAELAPFTWAASHLAPDFSTDVGVYAVGRQQGYFEAQGLAVEELLTDGSTAAIQAVASGSADIGSAGPSAVLAAREQGVPIVAIGGLLSTFPWQLATLPGSTLDADSLEGSRIGVISLTSGSYTFTQALLKAHDLTIDQVEIIPVGTGVSAAQALESGQVDSIALYTLPYRGLEAEGFEFRYLDNPRSMDALFDTVWVTSEETLASDDGRAALIGFLRGAAQSMLLSSANPGAGVDAAYEIIPELEPKEGDPVENKKSNMATFSAWLELCVPSGSSGDPADWEDWFRLTDDRWDVMVDYSLDTGLITQKVDVGEFWDSSLLEEVNDFDRKPVLDRASELSQE